MTEQHIQPHKVTKPIQLLAAWLVGLIVINGTFLTAAVHFDKDTWECGALVIATIVNVPIFLIALFLLQTKFRAELQEDSFYAEYLSKKTSALVLVEKNATSTVGVHSVVSLDSPSDAAPNWTSWRVALNALHPEAKKLRGALRTSGIPLAELYSGDGTVPKSWVISLSYSLPATHKVHLLRAVLPFGFDGISFWDPRPEADETEHVYIGSYGVDDYVKVTADLNELINSSPEEVDLMYYYKNHVQRADE